MASRVRTKNAIFIEINQRFLPYLEVFLKGLRRVHRDYPDLFIHHTDLTEEQTRRLSRYEGLRTVQLEDADFAAGPAMATHRPKHADPRISYARFLIWTQRLKDYENVLHLDTDLLILGRFDELLDGVRFRIFAETYQSSDALFYDARDPMLTRLLEEDGIHLPDKVGNCGVFVVPKKDRTPENFDLLNTLLSRYGPFIKWSDQSIINLWMVMKGYEVEEGDRFNFQHRLVTRPGRVNGLRQARIFHFNGVDLTYRLFLQRCAGVLSRLPAGWELYRLVYRATDGLLRVWRSWKVWLRSLAAADWTRKIRAPEETRAEPL